MTAALALKVTGEVQADTTLGQRELRQIPDVYQIPDFSQIEPKRSGRAVKLAGLLEAVGTKDTAKFMTLHSAYDDFHASIPLADVRERGYVIYELNEEPLPRENGGPVRFFIPDHAQCNTEEIDECANVKFVDHIELTTERGFDNRPTDEEEHAKLHSHD